MRKLLVFAAALAAAATLAGAVGAGSSAAEGRRTITLLDRKTDDGELDLDHSGGGSPGDVSIFTSEELDRDGDVVGVGNGRITLMYGHVLVDVTLTLRGRGQLTFSGADDLDSASGRLALTGGTGDFRKARGELRFETVDERDTRLEIRLVR